jgi:uroporphyrinogen-III synthase
VRGQRFLVLRGESAWEKVPEALAESGGIVDAVECYAAKPEMSDPTGDGARLAEEGADWIVFASGMAIEHFHARFDLPKLMARFPGTRLAIANVSIKWALDKLRLKPAVIAQSNDVENLVNAITKAMHSDVFSTISGESRMNETDRLPEVCAIS